MLKFPDGSTRIVCQGLFRARLVEVVQTEPYLIGRIEPLEDVVEEGVELDALVHHVNRLFQRMVDQSQQVPEELQVAAMNTREPGRLADLLGSSLPFSIEEKQELLGEIERPRPAGEARPVPLAAARRPGARRARSRRRSARRSPRPSATTSSASRSRRSRRSWARGRATTPSSTSSGSKLEKAKPPAEVLAEAEREIERLAGMHPSSAEYSIVRTYLDWLAVAPLERSRAATGSTCDGRRKILDADHYDLEKIKERILEYLAVRKLKKDMKGPILCFAGPPGTGKTSLGKSIAKALGREFVRISLGGRPRRGRDPRPPPHLRRRHARPDHPGDPQGGDEQPGLHARRGRQARRRLPRRPLRRAPGSARPRAERRPSATITSTSISTSRR